MTCVPRSITRHSRAALEVSVGATSVPAAGAAVLAAVDSPTAGSAAADSVEAAAGSEYEERGEEVTAGDGRRKTSRSARGSIRDVSGTDPHRRRADPRDTRTADSR